MGRRKVETKPVDRKPIHRTVANILIEKLKDRVVIQKYEAPYGSEIYLKFDYGLLGSLKITDVEDTDTSYKYKYTLVSTARTGGIIKDGVTERYYYCMETLDDIARDVIRAKNIKENLNGKEEYKRRLEEKIEQDIRGNKVSKHLNSVLDGRAYNSLDENTKELIVS